MKKVFLAVLMFVMGIAFLLPTMNHANAQSNGEITWGKVMTGVYNDLHPYTLNWSGNVLDKGGLNLTSMKVMESHEADLVINQYGAIGASGILKLNGEQLEEPTNNTQSGFQSSYTLSQGDIYLIVLHNGKHAKIRIDRVLPGKVFFSYVLQAGPNTAPAANPSATNPAGTGQAAQVPPTPVQTFPTALFGTWNIYFSSTSQPAEAVGGLSINPNGTYTQKKKDAGEVTGYWRTAKPKEVSGYTEAILLQNGLEKTDWAVVPQGNGKILLLQKSVASSGPLYGNTLHVVWMPLYVGTKLSADSAPIASIKGTNYDYSVFQGKWSLWVQGGATNLYYKDTGNYATHQYDPGAGGGSLIVNADGTYTMNTNEKATGKWRPSKVNEVYGYDWSIILGKGPGGIDWAILINNNGKTMVAYDTGGKWTDGSKMWAPYYIADRIE